jgi:phosphopantetheinyl transferase
MKLMRLYISGIRPFMDLDGIGLVTNARRERIQAYIQAADKARCLVAGLLLRRFCGVTDDCQLAFGKKGKPYLTDKDIYFNLSHSGDYVVLATSDGEVGADIEKIKAYDVAVAAKCFTPQELDWLRAQKSDEAFYTIWTAKESVMKGFGLGFALPPESFCILPVNSSPHHINGRNWFIKWSVYDGHIVCGANSGKTAAAGLTYVSSNELI